MKSDNIGALIDEDEVQQLAPSVSSKDADLQTTLVVSTRFPDGPHGESSVEIATIR